MSPVERWDKGWRARCEDCGWSSKRLPFPNPEAALHTLSLHKALCKGAK